MKTLKAYIIYGGGGKWLEASLVAENGCVLAGHICSRPGFMVGDLWLNRPERQKALADMGYELELVGAPIAGSDNAPLEILAAYQNENGWKAFSEQWDAALKAQEPATR